MKNVAIVIILIGLTVLATLFFTKDKASSPTTELTIANSANDIGSIETKTPGDKLDYSNKGLTEFPKEILSKTNAVSLDLSGNNLTGSLPAEIKDLRKLEILNVSDNNMTGIPAEIGQMTRLRVLNYADNGITGLPNELGNLKNLEVFDLSGNNPAQQDLEGIRAKLPSSVQIIL